MDRQEYLMTISIFVFMLLTFGAVFGIILNICGFNPVSATSLQYWLGISSLLIPTIIPIVLSRYNISPTSIFARMLYFYSACITYLTLSSFVLQQSIDLWQYFMGVAAFSIIYPCLLFLIQHEWVQVRIQSAQRYFSRKSHTK